MNYSLAPQPVAMGGSEGALGAPRSLCGGREVNGINVFPWWSRNLGEPSESPGLQPFLPLLHPSLLPAVLVCCVTLMRGAMLSSPAVCAARAHQRALGYINKLTLHRHRANRG